MKEFLNNHAIGLTTFALSYLWVVVFTIELSRI